MKVHEIMTTQVVTAGLDTSLADVAQLLAHNRISAVPVLDASGVLAGLVSEFDLLSKKGATAADVMTTGVMTASEDTDVEDVRHLLVERHIGRLPVLAAGRVVGIVSRSDVVATMTKQWVCEVCGEAVAGPRIPSSCPRCHGDGKRFALQEQPPGS